MTKRILIIGGNGFLGFNTAKKLSGFGFDLHLVCKNDKNLKKLSNVKYYFCDVNNTKKLEKLLKFKVDTVINFSGNIDHKNSVQTKKTHYYAVKNLINLLDKKKIKLFIQAGSSLEYGNYKSPQKEKYSCRPQSIYGTAKYNASKLLMKKKKNFNVIILRLYQIYGPHQKKDRLIPFIIDSSLKNLKFNCTNGDQKRDFMHVDDLTNLIFKIIKKKKLNSNIFNVGAGKPYKVRDVIKRIINITKKGRPVFGGIPMRKDEINEMFPSIKKVKKFFKWNAKVDLTKGLKHTINFYEKKNF